MTDDLITRLRATYSNQAPLYQEAADALEAQARRIAELERELASTREECRAQIDDMWEQQLEAKARQTDYGEGFEEGLAVQAARIAELDAALREAYEVYAGSDGFIPETAAEGYQQQLIKQMVDIIGAALEKKNDLRS